MHKGIVYDKMKETNLAVINCDKATSYQVNYAEAYFNKGLSLMNIGEYTKAIDNFDIVIN